MSQSISHKRFIIHPYKFNMWLAIVAMIMMFAAFTSAYVVKKADFRYWVDVPFLKCSLFSTITILLSSVFMHLSLVTFRRNQVSLHRLFMLLTLVAGTSFLAMQIMGWQELYDNGIKLNGNVGVIPVCYIRSPFPACGRWCDRTAGFLCICVHPIQESG